MSRSPEQRWSAEHSQRFFNEHYKQMRGLIRLQVTRENLKLQLGEYLKFPKRTIDIGGGKGFDAFWLAGQGHDVVLVNPHEDELKEAYQTKYPVLEDILVGDSETALATYGPESFDFVLHHGVLLYLDAPDQELVRLSQLLKPNGYLSLLTAGKFGKIKRFEDRRDQTSLDQLLLSGQYINEDGAQATAYLPQDIESMLERSGFTVDNWFGVRSLEADKDRRMIDDVPAFHRNRLIAEEIRYSRDPVRRPEGQMLHYIARKNT